MNYYDNEAVPVSDLDMIWDTINRRYVLTIDAVDNEFNATLVKFAGSEETAEAILKEVSADMYKFIYRYNRRDEKKRRAVEHMLSKNADLRPILKATMLDMMRANIRSGYSLQKDFMFINPERGTVLDTRQVPSIAPDAIEGLFASGILFKGEYSYRITDDDYRSDY